MAMDATPPPTYWNHNVHYDPLLLAAVPRPCGNALEVGCADGRFAARLAARCAHVTGIDSDANMIRDARQRCRDAANVTLIEADFLAQPSGSNDFDFACANTVLHHMDFEAALARMRDLLKPGGRLAIIGLARDGSPADRLPDLVAAPANRVLRAVHGESYPAAPIADPTMTWAEVRTAARTLLPGATYRRRLLWRYSLTWRRPT
jgi:SAM-dependent methyltransferase